MLKLWKGLFYCMWMSDKAQVQDELADRELPSERPVPHAQHRQERSCCVRT